MKNRITVFTPTYNRVELLDRCYKSLEKQGNKNFEWLVIDDGSDDDTKEYMNKVLKKADFKIIYIYQENGGKHRAFNLAVKKCRTEFLLILDSDDILADDAIEVLNQKSESIHDKIGVCGIIGNRGRIGKDGVFGTKMPDLEFASGLELYQKMGLKGDTLRVYKTSVLRKYPFPEFEGENFVSENVVFDKIDQKYKMLVIPEILYLGEYQEDGLTSNINKVRLENPIGYAASLKSMAETALTLRKKIGGTILYILWTRKFHIRKTFRDYKNKLIYLVCVPISFIFGILKVPRFYFDMFKEVDNG